MLENTMNTDFDIDIFINHDKPLRHTEQLESVIYDYLYGIDDLIKDHLNENENWSWTKIKNDLSVGFRCDLIEET